MADRRTGIRARSGDHALTFMPRSEARVARRPGWAALAGTALALVSLGGMWRAGEQARVDLEDRANADAATAAAGYLALTVPWSATDPFPFARLLSAANIVQRAPAWRHAGLQVGVGRVALLNDPAGTSRMDSAARAALTRGHRSTIVVRRGRRMAAVPVDAGEGGAGIILVVAWNAFRADRGGRYLRVLAVGAAMGAVFAALVAPWTRSARERLLLWAVPVTAAAAVAIGLFQVRSAASRASGDAALARAAGLAGMADFAAEGVENRLGTLAPGMRVEAAADDDTSPRSSDTVLRVSRVITLRSGRRLRISPLHGTSDLIGRRLGAWTALLAVGVAVAVRWDRPRTADG